MTKLKTILLLTTATLALAACGAPPTTAPVAQPTAALMTTDAPTSEPAPKPTEAMAGMTGTETAAPYDAQFIDGMIMHHQGAIDMANDALKQAQRPEIKTLAGDIIKAQEAEIKQMQDWRTAWYSDFKDTGGMSMDMGMMEVAPGDAPYDIRFIDAMIPHHESAIAMANDAKMKSQRPEILTLADEIIKAQTAEIAQMKAWRAEWTGSAAAAANAEAMIQAPASAMVTSDEIIIDLVKSPEAGWLVIHAGTDGQPGDMLGYVAVPAGETKGVKVTLSEVAPDMIAMLHVDEGTAGTYEFPGADGPLLVDGKPVMAAFGTMAH